MPLPVAAAAIAGGASLLGGLLNLYGQSQANEQNIAMQRETNALNYQMFHESQEFAKSQQQLAMEYNDPSSQVERLRKAGINPVSVFGNGSVSDVSQANAPSAPNMVAPQVQPLDYSGIGSAAQFSTQAFFDNELRAASVDKTKQEARIAQIQAEMDSAALENRLAKIANDKSLSDYERESAAIHLSILRSTQENLVKQEGLKTDILEKQALELDLRNKAQELSNKIADIDLKWHDKEKSANFKLFQANIQHALAAARAGDAQAASLYADQALKEAQKAGVSIDNEIRDRTKDEIVNQAYLETGRKQEETNKAFWDTKLARKDFIYGRTTSGLMPDFRSLFRHD